MDSPATSRYSNEDKNLTDKFQKLSLLSRRERRKKEREEKRKESDRKKATRGKRPILTKIYDGTAIPGFIEPNEDSTTDVRESTPLELNSILNVIEENVVVQEEEQITDHEEEDLRIDCEEIVEMLIREVERVDGEVPAPQEDEREIVPEEVVDQDDEVVEIVDATRNNQQIEPPINPNTEIVVRVLRRSTRIRRVPDRFCYEWNHLRRRAPARKRKSAKLVQAAVRPKKAKPSAPVAAPTVKIPRNTPFKSRMEAPKKKLIGLINHSWTIEDVSDVHNAIQEAEEMIEEYDYGSAELDIRADLSLLRRKLRKVSAPKEIQLKVLKNGMRRIEKAMNSRIV